MPYWRSAFYRKSIVLLSVFIGRGYLQHTGAGYRREEALQSYIYMIREGCKVKDVVPFSFHCLLGCRKGLANVSTAGKGDAVDKQVKRKRTRSQEWELAGGVPSTSRGEGVWLYASET